MAADRTFPAARVEGRPIAPGTESEGDEDVPGEAAARPWWGRGAVVAGFIATAALVLGAEVSALGVLVLGPVAVEVRPEPVTRADPEHSPGPEPVARADPEHSPGPEAVARAASAVEVDPPAPATPALPTEPAEPLGYRLFVRDWRSDDPRCHGGDGLGPLYNETSCLACHGQASPGGSGPASANVELITAVMGGEVSFGGRRHVFNAGSDFFPENRAFLVRANPGFRDALSTTLHRSGTWPGYDEWRARLVGYDPEGHPSTGGVAWTNSSIRDDDFPPRRVRTLIPAGFYETRYARSLDALYRGDVFGATQVVGGTAAYEEEAIRSYPVSLVMSRRNPPPLFGSGLIDVVPEAEILANAARSHAARPEISGRPARVAGGKLGRFGWKGQVASLEEFVASACANELGLEVPGHHQAASPGAPDAPAKGLDMTGDECDALVDYVRRLPPPAAEEPVPGESLAVERGRALFGSIGCAACHTPDLGPARGIYSDLLLHEMGAGLSDNGSYYAAEPASADAPPEGGEWRTPPLWGLRDSGPYLHDGRAETVEQAVALHGGEAEEVAKRYFALSAPQRLELDAFLATLAAPAAGPEPPRAEAVPRPKGPGAAWVERQMAQHDRGVRAEVAKVVDAHRSPAHPSEGPRPAPRAASRGGHRTPARGRRG